MSDLPYKPGSIGYNKEREEHADRFFKELNERLAEDKRKSQDPIYKDQQKNK